ncbi:hypothetical protein CPLU01_15855, partial [Colletotrichum plurivorum]
PTSKQSPFAPRRTDYPFATLRDAINITILSHPKSPERQAGLVYSQYYNLIKVPFDSAKQYPFQNSQLECLALDPLYLKQREEAGRAVGAKLSTLILAYRLSKLRIHINTPTVHPPDEGPDPSTPAPTHHARPMSFGIRAEDRVSLTLLARIIKLCKSDSSVPSHADAIPECAPFYAVPSDTMSRFLRATVNRYCFLYEYTKSQTMMKFSLPETLVMATALRGLRFSYGSSLIQKESVLWKDKWTTKHKVRGPNGVLTEVETEKEGLNLKASIDKYGFGWWAPQKFNWAFWRFFDAVADNLAIGNSILSGEYKRQWRVVRDLRDVQVRLWQARRWVLAHDIHRDANRQVIWLEYLWSVVIEQFDRDVWGEVHKFSLRKSGCDIILEATRQFPIEEPPIFCFDTLKHWFHDEARDMSHTRPHLVTGNHARHSSPLLLARDLFDWTKQDRVLSLRKGWNAKPFRVATRVAYDAVQANFGTQQAASWLEALHHLVVLTRWILPWPSESALFDTTKQQRGKNKFRRLMWFSTIYSPERIQPSGRVNHDPRGIPVEDRTHYFTSNDQLSDWTNSMMDDLFFSKGWLDPEDNTQPRFFIRAGDIISKVTSDHTKPLDFIYSPALSCGRAVDGHPNAKNGQPYPLVDPGRPPQLLMSIPAGHHSSSWCTPSAGGQSRSLTTSSSASWMQYRLVETLAPTQSNKS